MTSAIMPTYARADIEMVRGEGVYMFDAQGRKYLDFISGIGVMALGHCHPHLVKALHEQGARLWHTSNLYRIPLAERLAERLAAVTFADTMFFTNSGAEAWECSVKVARSYHHAMGTPQKFRIITCSNAFHGRTMAGIASTDQEKLRKGFEPLPDWFKVVPFNDLAAVEAAIDDSVGAIKFEPIQGEGGFTAATPEFMTGVRKLCDDHGLLMILDEIQCGVGRTGKLFAHEHYGITPDVMSIAKGIGGGFPVGACLATERAAIGMTAGTHGSTYGGNPLAMAVANAVLDIVLEPGFLEHATQMGQRLEAAFQQLTPNLDDIFDPDAPLPGMGLMRGIKCKVPNRDFVNHARSEGILAAAAGKDVMRFLPPLIIEQNHIDEACERISAAAKTYRKPEA
ncbi:MAG: aspartate aminotransferase family protein [Sphingomonadales bacterium]|nr:MAG: aspartate aminotransferase family protein [Sphingomonadales bacterium]